jgi:hypothetical protein
MPARFVPFIEAIQYTGTNGSVILGLIPGWPIDDAWTTFIYPTLVSETGGVAMLSLVTPWESYGLTLNTGDWVQIPPTGSSLDVVHTYLAADFPRRFIPDPS